VPAAAEKTATLAGAVSRIRWRLRHAQTERALALIGDTLADLDTLLEAADNRRARKVVTLSRALEHVIDDVVPGAAAVISASGHSHCHRPGYARTCAR